MIEVGEAAPDFCLPNQDGVEICLRDILGKWIVLYFYPKDNTPGCTTEACDFTAAKDDFTSLGAIVLGVSADSPKKHQNFIAKHNLGITLLSDESTNMMQEYGAWRLKKNYGKEYMGIARSTYIIDPKGIVAASWSSVTVRAKRKKDGQTIERLHTDLVKEKLKDLQQK
jgi:thioredoxin-dependent peroxiredoxin